ncbi:MYXO-CTERM sorting domain-containing protein [Chromatiaceae bacterium AAb-1]|nr:MYXO-CTERM sorting domain-containing protein [Chromatiaceae bacterium AAb-1]
MKAFIATLILLFSSCSQAALIRFEADKSQYYTGDTIKVNLIVSQFSSVLGGFFAELLHNPLQLALQNWQFGTGFDDGLGSMQDWGYTAQGTLALSDYTFATDEAQLSQQGDSFVLASFDFEALTAGNFWLDLNSNNSGLLSFDNDFVSYTNAPLNISVLAPAQIPVPATAMLLLAGLALLRTRRH